MADPFDSLLGLEDTFYEEGYQLGIADGSRAGRIEGRVFGLEKGFEKYVAMGRLHGKSAVWAGRLPKAAKQRSDKDQPNGRAGEHHDIHLQRSRSNQSEGDMGSKRVEGAPSPYRLPYFPDNARLATYIQTLYALVEPASLSTQNTEESVSEFDDRLRRAAAKVRLIEKFTGEYNVDEDAEVAGPGRTDRRSNRIDGAATGDENNIEDITAPNARR